MKIKTTYISDDDQFEFDKKADCLLYERICGPATAAIARLIDKPGRDAYDFFWSGHYIQQDLQVVAAVRQVLIELTAEALGETQETVAALDPDTIKNALGGVHGPNQFRPLRIGWERLFNTDELGREVNFGSQLPATTEYKP
jgi:hypothetical protein